MTRLLGDLSTGLLGDIVTGFLRDIVALLERQTIRGIRYEQPGNGAERIFCVILPIFFNL